MKNSAEHSITIGLELRFLLFGLQSALAVSFSALEIERVFSDAQADQVSAKTYEFFRSKEVIVEGSVEAYEPETIRVRLAHPGAAELLPRIVEGAQHEVIRIRRSDELNGASGEADR